MCPPEGDSDIAVIFDGTPHLTLCDVCISCPFIFTLDFEDTQRSLVVTGCYSLSSRCLLSPYPVLCVILRPGPPILPCLPHSFGFGIRCQSLALFLLFIASFLRSFNMLSLARRRFLNGLDRRYIYGRVVCIFFPTLWWFRMTWNCLGSSTLLLPSTEY